MCLQGPVALYVICVKMLYPRALQPRSTVLIFQNKTFGIRQDFERNKDRTSIRRWLFSTKFFLLQGLLQTHSHKKMVFKCSFFMTYSFLGTQNATFPLPAARFQFYNAPCIVSQDYSVEFVFQQKSHLHIAVLP